MIWRILSRRSSGSSTSMPSLWRSSSPRGHPLVGTDNDVSHGRSIRQHAIVFREVGLWREVQGHLEHVVGQQDHRDAIQGIDAHLVFIIQRQQVPALVKQLQRIGTDHLLVALGLELLVAYAQATVGVDGADDDVEILFAGRGILEHQTLLHGGTVGQHAMDGERGEEPMFDAVVAEHILIADEVLVKTFVAVDDDAKHIQNGIAMAVER